MSLTESGDGARRAWEGGVGTIPIPDSVSVILINY